MNNRNNNINNNNNNNNMINNEEYIEIDLREYIMTLWNNKWLIIALVIVSVLAAGLYSKYITEPKYRAESTLLIFPSTYKTSLEVSTLPIDTYRSLAMTASIKNKIIEELDLRNSEGDIYSPSDLDKMLSIEIQTFDQNQQNNGDSFQAPVITLKVVNTDPKLAADIANSWSHHFMNDCKELRQNEVQEVSTVIEQQFNDTQEKLEDAKKKLKGFKEEARIEIINSELNAKENKLDNFNSTIVKLKTKLGNAQANLVHLNEQISEMSNKNKWYGELDEDLLNYDNNGNIQSKSNYIEAQKQLINYKNENSISLLKKEISHENDLLLEYKNKITELKTILNQDYINKIINLKNELAKEKANKEHLKEMIDKRESNGKWINQITNGEKSQNKMVGNYLESQNKLLSYLENHDVDLLNLKLSYNKDLLKNYINELDSLKNTLKVRKTENEEIRNIIEDESDRWELKKAITTDAIWENILSPEQISQIKNMKLTNEIVNPIYKTLRTRLSNNNIIINSYPKQISHYQKLVEEKRSLVKKQNHKLKTWQQIIDNINNEINHHAKLYDRLAKNYRKLKIDLENTNIKINSLQSQITYFENYQIKNIKGKISNYEKLVNDKEENIKRLNNKLETSQQTISNLQNDVNNYKTIYQNEATTYQKLVDQKLKKEIQIASLENELDYYKENKNELLAEIKTLQSKIWSAQNKKERLAQNVEDLKKTYDMLSTKAEEARLTQAQKTGDVKFVAEAITPSKPININTRLNIAIAAVLALFLGIFLVFFKEFLKEHDNE